MLRGIWLQIAGGRSSDAVKIMDSFFTVCSLKYARKLISHAMLHFPIIISPFIPVCCSRVEPKLIYNLQFKPRNSSRWIPNELKSKQGQARCTLSTHEKSKHEGFENAKQRKNRTNYNGGICILMLIKVLPFVTITFKCCYWLYF